MRSTVLVDFDGVLKLWPDPDWTTSLERRAGLEPGTFRRLVLDPGLLRQVTTGGITKSEWRRIAHERVGQAHVVQAWFERPTTVDRRVIEVVDTLRLSHIRAYVFTNGTDETAKEFVDLGLGRHFDGLINSWDLGVCKPTHEAFEACLRVVGADAGAVCLVDDSAENVQAAKCLGFEAHQYATLEGMVAFLADQHGGVGQ